MLNLYKEEEGYMRRVNILLIGLIFFVSIYVDAATRDVKGLVVGRYYNDVWQSWIEKPITVYIDDRGNVYIKGGEGLISARGFLYARERGKFIQLLKKGLKWAETAKKEKIEITKNLGSFMKLGSVDWYGIKLTFFSTNKGQQTDVILYIVDFDNVFNRITLYLNPEQVKGLITLLEKVPQTLKELKENEKKAKMLN